MKKLLAMLLALVMVLSFAACTDEEPEQTEEPSQSETETPETPDEPAFEAVHVEHADWAEDVKKAINDFVDTYGKASATYAEGSSFVVFDFDNTCSIFDVEEQLAIHQLRTMSFAITPENIADVLYTEIGDHDELRENDYSAEATSYTQWVNDITKAYTYLYETYGPFTAAGLDEAAQATIQADEQWLEFATKMRAMYSFVGDVESASVSYPWILYWFTGMTEQEVYDLAYASHKKYEAVESNYETWTSPEIESEAGIVTVEFTNGTGVSDNIRELYKVLDENGIDVWVCSASGTDPIRAAIDAYGLHEYCTGMIAMTNVVGEDGKYINTYDYENGCGWVVDGEGWVRGDLPIKAQTQGVGKVTAISNAIVPQYNNVGPLAGFMDSTGDFNFCTEYANLKLVINFNRANRKVTDGGGLIAELAIYQRDTLGYDLATANAAGDTLYVLQGREENGLRGLRPSNLTMRLDKTEEALFRNEDNEAQLQYMIDNAMTTADIINRFAVKTDADAEGNDLGIKYGCVSEYAGYHNIK